MTHTELGTEPLRAGPLASILVPTFNRPQYLRLTIEAALASTVGDIEVVVRDDGTDGLQVCDAVGDPRLRYERNPERLGMAGNWNALLDDARGRFVVLCMDDDILAPTFLERCLREFESDPELGVVFTNHSFDSAGECRVRDCRLRHGRHDSFASDFLRHQPVAIGAMLFRSALWTAVRPLPDTAAADMVLIGRLAERGSSFFYVDEPLMTYRVHSEQFSGTPGFRDDGVHAWETLKFSDPEAERLREDVLARALVSRAKLALAQGNGGAAQADLRKARTLRSGISRLHYLGVEAVARTAPYSRPFVGVARTAARRGRALRRRVAARVPTR